MTQEMKLVRLEGKRLDQAITDIQRNADKYSLKALNAMGSLQKAVTIAEGIRILRQAITPLLPNLMELMNTPLGFMTDRDPSRPGKSGAIEPYPVAIVADCLIEFLMRGISISGNQGNIIAGRAYSTVEGYKALVEQIDGMTDLDFSLSPPFTLGGQTCIKARAQWKLHGRELHLKDSKGQDGAIYAVRVNAGMGVDAIIGKGRRRMYKAIFELSTGVRFTEPMDQDEAPTGEVPPEIAAAPTRTQEVLAHVQQAEKKDTPTIPEALPGRRMGRLAPDLRDKILALDGLVDEDEFQLVLEEYGVAKVEQLPQDFAEELLIRLEALRDGREK